MPCVRVPCLIVLYPVACREKAGGRGLFASRSVAQTTTLRREALAVAVRVPWVRVPCLVVLCPVVFWKEALFLFTLRSVAETAICRLPPLSPPSPLSLVVLAPLVVCPCLFGRWGGWPRSCVHCSSICGRHYCTWCSLVVVYDMTIVDIFFRGGCPPPEFVCESITPPLAIIGLCLEIAESLK